MKYLLKELMELTNTSYNDTIAEVQKFDPTFKVTGGTNTKVTFNAFKAVCQNHSVEIDADGHITVYRDTDGGRVKFAPETIVVTPKVALTYEQRTLNEFNVLKGEKIDPLRVRAEMNQAPANATVAIELIKQLKVEKTILTDALIHDTAYLRGLFQKFPYALLPIQLAFRVRKQLEPMFIKMYMTDTFNNRLIAFNRDTVLYAYIIGV